MALTKVTTGTIADDSIQSLKNRNLIINGAMQVWQRGLTQTSTGYGCVDRWKNTVSGTTTFSQDTANLPTGFEYALRWTTGASSSYGQSRQYLETSTVKILRGRTLTASSYVKVSGSYSGYITFEIAYSTTSDSSVGNTWVQATRTSIVTASASDASSDYKRISCNVDIPSNAVGVYIGIIPSDTQASGQWVSVTGVQLEVGEVATPFEHEFFGDTVAKCQRYYCKSYNLDIPPQTNNSAGRHYFYLSPNTANGNKGSIVTFPVQMRSSPSVTIYNEASGTAGVFNNGSAATVIVQGQRSFLAYGTTTSNGLWAHWVADSEL